MNKSHRTVWNQHTQTWVAVSELSKRMGKAAVVASVVAFSANSYAATCVAPSAEASTSGNYLPGNAIPPCDAIPSETKTLGDVGYYILTRSRLNTTLNVGDVDITQTGNGFSGIGNQYALGSMGAAIKTGNVKLNMTNISNTTGMGSHSGVNITSKNVDITSVVNYAGTNLSGNAQAYGIVTGSSVSSGEGGTTLNGTYTTVTMDNLTLHQTTKGGLLPILNTGLRSIQGAYLNSGNGSAGKIVINNQLNMYLKGERIEGIYVSGDAKDAAGNEAVAQVVLNNSNIKLEATDPAIAAARRQNSAIKIGKGRAVGTGKGAVYSTGTMNIDTSQAKGEAAIKLYASGSLLKADYANSSTNVLANESAIVVSPDDWYDATFNPTGTKSGVASKDIEVDLKNANLSTVSNTASLIKVYENQQNFKLNLSGDNTILNAAPNGWMIEIGAPSQTGNTVAGSTIANLTGGKYFGMTTISDAKATNPSTLTMNMDGPNTVWYLVPNNGQTGDAATTSTFTTLNLSNGATVNATNTVRPSNKTVNLFDGYSMVNPDGNNLITSPMTADNSFTLRGNVNSNGGVIDLSNRDAATGSALPLYITTLNIDGNYTGTNGAIVRMNTVWNAPGSITGANSYSDVLNITGSATGTTQVIPVTRGGVSNIIEGSVQQIASVLNTIPVITVGSSNGTAFVGTAETTGATEVQLTSTADGRNYYWTMAAKVVSPPPPPPPTCNETGTCPPPPPPPPPPPHPPEPPIYNPKVPGYVQMPLVDMELGYTTLATLHERRGENQVMAWDACGCVQKHARYQTWGRIFGKHLSMDGKERFNMGMNQYGFQLGHDFNIHYNPNTGSRRQSGMYVAYAQADADFYDRYRAVNGYISNDKFTGKGKVKAYTLGLSSTYYDKNGSYLDLVGQASYLQNKYVPRNDFKTVGQNGWSAALSAEAGRPYAIGKSQWLIEPQAQLVYQYLHLSDFNDGVRYVSQSNQQGLRGRLGVRLAYNRNHSYLTDTFYITANVLHDFIKPASVNIGPDTLSERYSNTWGEIGLGAQTPMGKHSYLYADARYEHSLGGAKRSGYRGSIGFKYTWK